MRLHFVSGSPSHARTAANGPTFRYRITDQPVSEDRTDRAHKERHRRRHAARRLQ